MQERIKETCQHRVCAHSSSTASTMRGYIKQKISVAIAQDMPSKRPRMKFSSSVVGQVIWIATDIIMHCNLLLVVVEY